MWITNCKIYIKRKKKKKTLQILYKKEEEKKTLTELINQHNKFTFYTLPMNNLKRKLRKKSIYNGIRKNKIFRNKFNQEG